MADREEQRPARGKKRKPRRRRSTALYVILGLIGLVVAGCFVGIALLAGWQSGGTPIGDILARSESEEELVEVAGTVEEVQPSSLGNMVWYRLADATGSIWVNAAIEGGANLQQVGFVSGGRVWALAPEPKPEVGDARRVRGVVIPSAPPDAPAGAGPYLLPAKPQAGE